MLCSRLEEKAHSDSQEYSKNTREQGIKRVERTCVSFAAQQYNFTQNVQGIDVLQITYIGNVLWKGLHAQTTCYGLKNKRKPHILHADSIGISPSKLGSIHFECIERIANWRYPAVHCETHFGGSVRYITLILIAVVGLCCVVSSCRSSSLIK